MSEDAVPQQMPWAPKPCAYLLSSLSCRLAQPVLPPANLPRTGAFGGAHTECILNAALLIQADYQTCNRIAAMDVVKTFELKLFLHSKRPEWRRDSWCYDTSC